jgi:hypothetical protein
MRIFFLAPRIFDKAPEGNEHGRADDAAKSYRVVVIAM